MQDLIAEKNAVFAELDALEREISHRWRAHQKRGKVSPPPAHWYERRAELHRRYDAALARLGEALKC